MTLDCNAVIKATPLNDAPKEFYVYEYVHESVSEYAFRAVKYYSHLQHMGTPMGNPEGYKKLLELGHPEVKTYDCYFKIVQNELAAIWKLREAEPYDTHVEAIQQINNHFVNEFVNHKDLGPLLSLKAYELHLAISFYSNGKVVDTEGNIIKMPPPQEYSKTENIVDIFKADLLKHDYTRASKLADDFCEKVESLIEADCYNVYAQSVIDSL